MNRKEYMEQLDMLLRDIPHTERREALKYYEDYFEDAGAEHEADVIEELGDPKELAKKLREDLKREEEEKRLEKSERRGMEEAENQTQEAQTGNFQNGSFQNGSMVGAEACLKKNSKKGPNALAVCFIILGILMGIGHLFRFTRSIVWLAGGMKIEPGELVTGDYDVEYGEIGAMDLEIEAGFGEVVIECWNEESISVSYPGNYMKVEREDDKLSIKPRGKWGFFSWFGIWDEEGWNYRTVVKIPREFIFREVDISTGAGTVDIEELEAVSLFLTTGAGELTAEKVYASEDIRIEAGVGETVIRDLTASEAEFSVGVGELYVEGRVGGDISADCGVGELELTLDNREADFNYDISCGVGDVSVNGKNYSGIGASHGENNGARQDFNISCGVGSVKVTFLR